MRKQTSNVIESLSGFYLESLPEVDLWGRAFVEVCQKVRILGSSLQKIYGHRVMQKCVEIKGNLSDCRGKASFYNVALTSLSLAQVLYDDYQKCSSIKEFLEKEIMLRGWKSDDTVPNLLTLLSPIIGSYSIIGSACFELSVTLAWRNREKIADAIRKAWDRLKNAVQSPSDSSQLTEQSYDPNMCRRCGHDKSAHSSDGNCAVCCSDYDSSYSQGTNNRTESEGCNIL